MEKIFLPIISLFFFLTGIPEAATIISTGSGNWNSTTVNAPWPNGIVPVAGDNVTIANGHTVTLNVATASLASLTINPGGIINGTNNLNIAGALKINGTFNGTGRIVMNTSGGTIDGTGTINAANRIDLSTAGTYTILSTANLIYNGISTAARIDVKAGVTLTNNGSINFTGFATGTGNITGNNATTSIWTNAANSTVKMISTGGGTGGPLNATLVFNCSATGNTVNYTGVSQTLRTNVLNYYHLTLSGSGTPVMPPTQTLNILGNFTNDGTTPNFGTDRVVFTGTVAQTIGGTSSNNFYNLTINNSAGVTILTNETVRGNLTLTSGNIITGANILTLGTGTGVLGTLSPTSGTIIGNFRRWFSATTVNNVLFPIGSSTNYRPVNISFTTAPTAGGTLTAFFTSSNPGTAGLPLNDGATQIINA